MSEEGEDLLAGGESPENQEAPDQPQAIDEGPPPSQVQMPDWVPSEYHDPAKRDELLSALGVEAKHQPITERPDYLPEKFWKEGEGPQIDSLAKSYTELEKKLGESGKIPPESYEIRPPEGVQTKEGESLLTEEDTALFKELGLNNDQAQQVFDHYWENVLPTLLEERAQSQHATLASQWGMTPGDNGEMPPEYKQRLGSIAQWAEKNLPEESVKALRTSASGIRAMWEMMQAKVALPGGEGAKSGPDQAEVQKLISSDEYWQDGPVGDAVRAKVAQATGVPSP